MREKEEPKLNQLFLSPGEEKVDVWMSDIISDGQQSKNESIIDRSH